MGSNIHLTVLTTVYTASSPKPKASEGGMLRQKKAKSKQKISSHESNINKSNNLKNRKTNTTTKTHAPRDLSPHHDTANAISEMVNGLGIEDDVPSDVCIPPLLLQQPLPLTTNSMVSRLQAKHQRASTAPAPRQPVRPTQSSTNIVYPKASQAKETAEPLAATQETSMSTTGRTDTDTFPHDQLKTISHTDISYQMESIQRDLRKAVHALVALRSRSEHTTSVGSALTDAEATKSSHVPPDPDQALSKLSRKQSLVARRMSISSPSNQADLRKDIAVVQEAIAMAKEHMDTLCVDWSKVTTNQSPEWIRSNLASANGTEQAGTATEVGSASGSDPFGEERNATQGTTESTTEKQETHGPREIQDNKSGDDGQNAELTAVIASLSTEVESLTQQLEGLRVERDTLAMANKSLVAAVHSLMEDHREQEQQQQQQQQKRKQVKRNGDGASVKLRVADSQITIHTDERKKLSKAVETLTSTLTSLLQEHDRLSRELKGMHAEFQAVEQLNHELQVENHNLLQQLQETRAKLKHATSDGKTVAAHGRVVSSSLVFARQELRSARKRIHELEQTVRDYEQTSA